MGMRVSVYEGEGERDDHFINSCGFYLVNLVPHRRAILKGICLFYATEVCC